MSEVLDLPTIDESMIAAEAPAPTMPVATTEPDKPQATLKDIVLASFSAIKAHCSTLAERYRGVAYDLKTPKGLTEAKAARHDLRENGRYAVQRLQERLNDEANDIKRVIKAEAATAIAEIMPVEDSLHEAIVAREQEIEAEKERARQAEAERVAKHQAGIARIRSFIEHAKADPDMTSARVQHGIDILRGMEFHSDFWQEFAVPAGNAQCETLEAMQQLHDQLRAREQEAARIEAQRIENERIAAELAEKQRQIDEQAAELARQQQEIEAKRQRAEAPAATATAAATEGKADNPEPGTLEAAPSQRSEMAVSTSAGQHSQESTGSIPVGSQECLAHGGADEARGGPAEDCEDLSGVAPGPLHPYDPNAQEGSSPADAPACASSEAEAAEASPSGDEGRDARADECASQPDPAMFPRELLESCIDPTIPADEVMRIDGRAPPPWFAPALKLARACDAGVISFDEMQRGYAALRTTECAAQDPGPSSAVETSEPVPPAAAHAEPDDGPFPQCPTCNEVFFPFCTRRDCPSLASLLPASAEPIADPAAAADIERRVILALDDPEDDDEGGIDGEIRDRVTNVVTLIRKARTSAFASQPKMPPEWWAELYVAVDALSAAAGEVA